jgi:hypothetical protein
MVNQVKSGHNQVMTVKELIAELRKMPKEMEVRSTGPYLEGYVIRVEEETDEGWESVNLVRD